MNLARTKSVSENQTLDTLEHLMAAGELLVSQLPSPTMMTPELRLAGAVLAAALVEVRDHARDRAYQRRIREDLEWIASEDQQWPFSFVRLCQLFRLDPQWVRAVVKGWVEGNGTFPSEAMRYRQAA